MRRALDSHYLTSFYGIVSQDGTFTYSNAGHNPPILVSASGVRRLETGGTPLGLFDFASFEQETLTLAPGDLIVSFSDGVTEALNQAGDEFTDPRLLASVDAHRSLSPQGLVDALLADVQAFTGGAAQSDDVTIVLVRFDGV